MSSVVEPIVRTFAEARRADVAAVRATMPSARAAAENVKGYCYFLDADLVGVCALADPAWTADPLGDHTYGISILVAHRRPIRRGEPGFEWIVGAEQVVADLRAMEIATVVARYLGTPGVVTSDMPLTSDRPIDFRLQDFCTKCTKCARECPVGAIRFGPKVMFNGYEMWKPDVDRCARYRITNMRGSACGRCMKTCPYNVEGVLAERPFQWAAMRLPFARAWIARLDDRLGRGGINPAKKWWLDFEMVDGTPVPPPKGANARGLNLDRKPRDEASFALFPPSIAPPGGDGMRPFPVDRKVGIEASKTAESPDDARQRAARR